MRIQEANVWKESSGAWFIEKELNSFLNRDFFFSFFPQPMLD